MQIQPDDGLGFFGVFARLNDLSDGLDEITADEMAVPDDDIVADICTTAGVHLLAGVSRAAAVSLGAGAAYFCLLNGGKPSLQFGDLPLQRLFVARGS